MPKNNIENRYQFEVPPEKNIRKEKKIDSEKKYYLVDDYQKLQERKENFYNFFKFLVDKNYETMVVTETANVPLGYAIKSAWRTAFPEKFSQCPKIVPLNVKLLRYDSPAGREEEKMIKNFKEKLNKLNIRKEDKIGLYDAWGGGGSGITLRIAKELIERAGYKNVEVLPIGGDNDPIVEPPTNVNPVTLFKDVYAEKIGSNIDKFIWREYVTRAPHPPGYLKSKKIEEQLRSKDWHKKLKEAKKEYTELTKITRVPRVLRKRAKMIIHDYKLFGEEVGERIKKEREEHRNV